MILRKRPNSDALAHDAAVHVAKRARQAIERRGVFTLALSGGSTPWAMLDQLVRLDNDWSSWQVFQVDERAAPDGDAARNWTQVTAHLIEPTGLDAAQCHPMPVLDPDREAAARRYAASLPAEFDLVQLGLGDDGHTASLVPDDPILDVDDRDVAWSGEYQGHRRMSLTYPPIERARDVVWLIAGRNKREALERVVAGDPRLPASRIRRGDAFVCV